MPSLLLSMIICSTDFLSVYLGSAAWPCPHPTSSAPSSLFTGGAKWEMDTVGTVHCSAPDKASVCYQQCFSTALYEPLWRILTPSQPDPVHMGVVELGFPVGLMNCTSGLMWSHPSHIDSCQCCLNLDNFRSLPWKIHLNAFCSPWVIPKQLPLLGSKKMPIFRALQTHHWDFTMDCENVHNQLEGQPPLPCV